MNNDQIEGKTKQAEGEGQESWGDAKEKADETWDEAKDKLDDLGDKIGETKDKLAKDKRGHDAEDDEVIEDAAREGEPELVRPYSDIRSWRFERRGGLSTAPLALSCGACGRRSSRDAGHLAEVGSAGRVAVPATRRWHQDNLQTRFVDVGDDRVERRGRRRLRHTGQSDGGRLTPPPGPDICLIL